MQEACTVGRDDKILLHELDFLMQVNDCVVAPALHETVSKAFKLAQDGFKNGLSRQRLLIELQGACIDIIKALEELIDELSPLCYGKDSILEKRPES
jgi:hypothetical protein